MPLGNPQERRSLYAPFSLASISGQLSYGIVLLVGLSLLSTAGALIFVSFQSQMQQLATLQHERSRSAADELSGYMDDLQRKLGYLARVRGLSEASAETQRNLLEGLSRHNRAYEAIAILDRSGRVVSAFAPYQQVSWRDLSRSPAFLRGFVQQEDYVSPVENTPDTRQPTLTLSVPIRNRQDQVDGVLLARINLSFLWFFVSRIEVGRTGYAYVIDHRKVLIAQQGDLPEAFQLKDMARYPFIQQVAADAGSSLAPYRGLRGVQVLGASAPIHSMRWRIVVELPTSEAYAPIRTMLTIMGLALGGASAAAMGLGFIYSRRIVSPLRSLTEAATRITSGELETRVEIHPPNELGILALAFNEMASQLHDLIGNLEREVGERRQAEAALRESETRLRAIIENTPDSIFIKDRTGRYVMINPAGAAYLGHSIAEVVGRRDVDLLPAKVASQLWENDQRVMTSGSAQSFEDSGAFGGVKRVFLAAKFPHVSAEGETIGVIGIARDITEQKKALEEIALRTAELKQAEELGRLKDHFLSTMSHEMKTPLSLIIGYAELLQEKYPEEELTRGLQDGSIRLSNHINNMLDYSALISGSLPLYKTEVDLPEIVQNAREIMETPFRLNDLRCFTEIHPNTPPIQGDSRRITQMLVELLDNARKNTERGGTVGIRVAPADGQVRIDVWDTGAGIPEGDYQRIWEAFSQLEVGDALRRGGIGLGLTIVKMLAELHGGKVKVESQFGRGTCFSIFLPIGEV